MLLALLGFGLVACQRGPVACESLEPGRDRDTCLAERVSVASDAAAVAAVAAGIADPVVRGAAVSRWLSEHGSGLQRAEGEALCDLLAGRDPDFCRRRLQAAHLNR